MTGAKQHYLPASLIGGFGIPAKSGRRRDSTVAVRRKATGMVDKGYPKAASLAFRKGMYRLAKPPAGLDRDAVDKLWDPVETNLPDLIGRLEGRRLQAGDNALLFEYVSNAAVRHPSFEAVAADYQGRMGLAVPVGDDVQALRVAALRNQRPQIPTWRWRVIHSPEDCPRFIITDRGWMYVGEPGWTSHGLFLPMGPRVAILGYLDDARLPPRRPPFEEHGELCLSWIEWFNAAAWAEPFIEMVIAHPSDRDRLANLPDHNDLRVTGYGPYRYRQSAGLFD